MVLLKVLSSTSSVSRIAELRRSVDSARDVDVDVEAPVVEEDEEEKPWISKRLAACGSSGKRDILLCFVSCFGQPESNGDVLKKIE